MLQIGGGGAATCVAIIFYFQSCNNETVLDCKTQCVRCPGPRHHSDSYCTIEWLIKNYHSNAWESAFFLHNGKQTSWHRRVLPQKNKFSTGLSHIIMREEWEYGHERPMLKAVANIFNVSSVDTFIESYQLHLHRCCNEAYFFQKDLHKTPFKILLALLRLMKKTPSEPWGWIIERILPILLQLSIP